MPCVYSKYTVHSSAMVCLTDFHCNCALLCFYKLRDRSKKFFFGGNQKHVTDSEFKLKFCSLSLACLACLWLFPSIVLPLSRLFSCVLEIQFASRHTATTSDLYYDVATEQWLWRCVLSKERAVRRWNLRGNPPQNPSSFPSFCSWQVGKPRWQEPPLSGWKVIKHHKSYQYF